MWVEFYSNNKPVTVKTDNIAYVFFDDSVKATRIHFVGEPLHDDLLVDENYKQALDKICQGNKEYV